ncbi:hypothetical protein HNS38_13850 [Lentimicrobium sp. L6]|uniref:hypothetical protein n=1 Tax=Lentimicrobium sp. L6 TaxID=2735916 RepID=UPI0015559286|nr:hypothetical protein [Lentimicrobium sp. L6]NPD85852.1 hypothetical protein [Lentimicrobium sp. L6]
MKRKTIKKLLITLSTIIVLILAIGYFGLNYLQAKLESSLTGCQLESSNFYEVLDFEYVNNWIIVKAKVDGGDKEYPFWFDTGAQTVLMDSLLNEIGENKYKRFSFGNKQDTSQNAFNNALVSLKELELGGVKFRDIGSISAKNSKWGMLNCISAYGIIGYNLIQTCVFQIDFDKQQITLTDNVEKLENYEEIQWVNYKPSKTQETPILPATFNDSIKIDLFFDTGSSGGITLSSEKLYRSLLQQFPNQTAEYISRPSLLIRGEKNEIGESFLFKASNFSFINNTSEEMIINVSNTPERDFTGIIGNRYLKNFNITLDYRNRRIGFIPKRNLKEPIDSTFGITYKPLRNKFVVSSIYSGYEPELSGIMPGDEIYSINGIRIDELDSDIFCKFYRGEYIFKNKEDSVLYIEITKGDSIIAYRFNKKNIFLGRDN